MQKKDNTEIPIKYGAKKMCAFILQNWISGKIDMKLSRSYWIEMKLFYISLTRLYDVSLFI